MLSVEEMVKDLSDSQLKQAFAELAEFRSTGDLKDTGVVQGIVGRINEEYFNFAESVHAVGKLEGALYFEMARRWCLQ